MTSSSEEVVLPSTNNTYLDLNGDVTVTSNTVPSVHDNIFFKAFGRQSRYHSTHCSEGDHKQNGSEIDISIDDENVEYRPGSGFVTRLRGKFTNLSTKEENNTPRLKRSSSLEQDVAVDKEILKKLATHKETSKTDSDKPGHPTTRSHKPDSTESLTHGANRSRQVFPVALRHVDRRDVDKPLKSPRESEIIAPDADLARDDIVIIENPPIPPLALEVNDDESRDENTPQISSYRDEVPFEELPKPNTVLNARNIFETASAGSSVSVTHGKKHRAESLSDVKYETASSKDKSRNDVTSSSSPVTSPRILSFDAPLPSWLSRRNSSDSVTALSTSATVRPDVTTNYTKPSSNDARPHSTSGLDVNSSTSRETKSHSLIFERRSLIDSGKTTDSPRPAPPPRSTASVKPIISSKPISSVNVKPILISNPPSEATSFKKSPVVPVAPFKKQEEKVDDGTPVMIYQKPKSPTRKGHVERTKKYDDLSTKGENGKKGDDKKDFIISNERKNNLFEKRNEANDNRSEKLSTSSNKADVKEKNVTNTREKTFSFIKPTVNDVTDNTVPEPNNKDLSSVSVGKDKTTISISSNKTQISVSNEPEHRQEPKKHRAPLPKKAATPKVEKESSKVNRAPEPPTTKTVKEDKSSSMIYVSSSSETSENDSSPPETPRSQPVKVTERVRISEPVKKCEPINETEPVKKPEPVNMSVGTKVPEPENNDKPIKGIPSIIANRLNKQKNSPRELSNSIADKGEPDSDVKLYNNDSGDGKSYSGDGKSYSLKNNDVEKSTKNAENTNQQPSKDAISSEIENEIAAVRKKINSNRSKGSGPAQIFDSSKLAKKREENRRQKAAAAAAAAAASHGIVPPLDFSGLNEDKSERVMRKEIKPCNIKFVGENAKTSRSLLKKQRKAKAAVQFRETISQTFEYPNEQQALEIYLHDHPQEPRELVEEENSIVFLDGLSEAGGMGESSDDMEINGDSDPKPDTQQRDNEDENLMSNPALSSTSNTLQSYRGRFQEDFTFGYNMYEPEPPSIPVVQDAAADPDSMMLRPAEEEGVNTWSTNDSSDLLF